MEVWKFVKDNDRYQVSNYGRVRSIDFTDTFIGRGGKPCQRLKKGRMLNISDNGHGYLKVGLAGIGQKYIHRLVADAFLPNPNNKETVNHKDGNKSNNNVENLEWATYSENQHHSKDTGLAITGDKHPQAKLSSEDVKFIRNKYTPRHKEFGCNALARKFGVSAGHVCNILKNKIRTHD